MLALEEAHAAAAASGVGLVTVVEAGHAGRIGAYVEEIAGLGDLAVAFCSGPLSGHRVAPFGGTDGRLSTNPIAFAFPGDEGLVVADFSTSSVPEGVVRRLRDSGLRAPEGALQTASGEPTTDPSALYADPPGTLLPVGGPRFGHKGYGFGLLVEAMTTVLAGEDATDPGRIGNTVTLLAIAGDDRVASAGSVLAGYVRSSRPADSARPVLLPGDLERAAARAGIVQVDEHTWEQLEELAAESSVEVPDRC